MLQSIPGVPDNIVSRMQKLLNLQEGAEAVGSLAEAENAAAKLQALLFQYNLDIGSVKKATISAKAEMYDNWIDLSDKADKREADWVPRLYGAIARNSMCTVSVDPKGIWIIGIAHNVQVVLYIAEQMIAKVRIAEKFAWKEYEKIPLEPWDNKKEKRGTFRRGFFQGATKGINQRLADENKNAQQEENPFAIMIVNQKKEVDEYVNEKYRKPHEERMKQLKDSGKKPPKVKYSKGPRQITSQVGLHTGYRAGLAMNINKGVDSNTDHKKLD